MDWFRENKFLGVWLIGTFLILVLLGVLLIKKRSAYIAAKNQYSSVANKVVALKKSKPYPSEENLTIQKKQVGELEGKVNLLKQELYKYQKPLVELSPSDFQAKLKVVLAEIEEKAKANEVVLGDGFNLDMGKYLSTPPVPKACSLLSYQLDSLKWLVNELIVSRPAVIEGASRTLLPVETGGADQEGKDPQLLSMFPFEIKFAGSMASVERFLNKASNSSPEDGFYHVVRLLELENEKKDGPVKEVSDLQEALKEENVSFDSPKMDNSQLIGEEAKFVMGEEKVAATVKLELVRFADQVKVEEGATSNN